MVKRLPACLEAVQKDGPEIPAIFSKNSQERPKCAGLVPYEL